MIKYSRKLVFIFILICSFIVPIIAFANSMEPPSIIILVNNPPDDLSIRLKNSDGAIKAVVRDVAWERYFMFYSFGREVGSSYIFEIEFEDERFELSYEKALSEYNEIFTLDLEKQTLIYGKTYTRAILLISTRLILTLLIEGAIFWLFGFRDKKSWQIFLVINLITQGALNIWLNNGATSVSSYLIFTLIFLEIFVFLFEMIAFTALIKEKRKRRTLFYAFSANMMSLVLGAYLIIYLPV